MANKTICVSAQFTEWEVEQLDALVQIIKEERHVDWVSKSEALRYALLDTLTRKKNNA